ncbi:SET and MYND domain-containing protein 4-like isoform X1 [Neodiprion pinetum]|uniref:SET and MYND domain-containing protein 4-like isoform X1 n=1 Tax=Neodiprion pinetum TaxID=441929 RepID=UPI001EDD240F|nr:SET and MYND domain-containing protein 4-like isoform X1 [Neodiprion pinetum]XP_046483307.1 SET and MYND domain-containing protein 4-like isoform X1 [Neodiprion pinetum]
MEELLSTLNRRILATKENHELVNRFSKLETDEERMTFALKVLSKYDVLPDYESKYKNSEESTKLREQGNRVFIGGWDYKAVEKYSESIAYAIESSEELALAYANRSAAQFRMEKYEESIGDIDRALSLNYPDKLKTKLFERKGLCLTALGRPDAELSFKEALNWLDKMSLSEEKTKKLKNQLKTFISAPCAFVELPATPIEYQLPEIISLNKEVPCASDALAIKYSKELGRHLVATRKIKPGEILAVEKPFCSILMPENVYTHCSNCLQVSWAMHPCKYCVYAMYCSETCKDQAWNEYHDVECGVVGSLLNLQLHMQGLFGMRLAIVATEKTKNWKELKIKLAKIDHSEDPRTRGYSEDGKFHSDQYSSLYSLVTNTDKRSVQDLFGRAFNAACITYVLSRESDLFGKELPKMLDTDSLAENPKVRFIGGLILKHLQIIPSNIHSFGELRGLEDYERGAAAMPFYSLINHSCDPNVTRQSRPKHIVLYALYPIAEGEQIFDNYGLHYALTVKNERQEKLRKQFYFDCECRPCREEWPLYDQLPSYQKQSLTQHNKNRLNKILQKHHRYIELAYDGKIENDPNMLQNLVKMIELLFDLVERPCIEINNVVETVKRVYALQGNRFDVPDKPYPKKA